MEREASSTPEGARVDEITLKSGLIFKNRDTRAQKLPERYSGTFRVDRGGVLLMDRDDRAMALVCANSDCGCPWQGRGFFVTATPTVDGRVRYMQSTCSSTERQLLIEGIGYMDMVSAAEHVLRQAQPLAAAWSPRDL